MNGRSIGYTGGGILKATSNGLRQQSIARRAEIKVSHRPECYCLRRHVFAVPSFSMRGIIIALIKLSEFRLFSSMNRWLSIKGSNV